MLWDFFQTLFEGGDIRTSLMSLLLSLPIFVLSLSFHEFGHAWMAYRCGDPTARLLGRCTLDPRRHIDPVGFLMLMLIGIGYAKPVPVNPRNLRNGVRDDFLVSIAGVCCNLILALIGAALLLAYMFFAVTTQHPLFFTPWMGYLEEMLLNLFVLNLVLLVFNLLPVPPLDGYHVVNDLLFRGRLIAPQRASQLGMGLLLILSLTGVLSKGISVFVNGAYSILIRLFRLILLYWG